MANQDAAFGFRPTRSLVGGQIRTEEYAIAANYNTAIYTGQVVKPLQLVGLKQPQLETHNNQVFSGAYLTQIQQLANQRGALIIQQAQMLLILKLQYMPILILFSKHNMMLLEQQL